MKGSQEPRVRVEPERVDSDGADAAMLMEAYGCKLDPWQEDIVSCWLGKDEQGNYTVSSAGLAMPRQNGKNICLEAREFYGMVVNGEKILHTAHQVKTSKKSFRRLVAMFNDKRHPEITDIVKQIRYTNGEESIELDNGGSIEYSARSRQAARGFDGLSLLVYDEAQELTEDQVEALMATLAASATGTRQIIYTGTPPYPGCPGDVFRRRRTVSLEAPGRHDAWHEWSVNAKSIEEIHVEDSSLWYMTNPALGIHLTEEFTQNELRTMSRDGFARERLGWWSPVLAKVTEYAINKADWEACRSAAPKPVGKTAYGVKFSPDGSEVCLCGAVIPEEGPARISMIRREPTGHGTKWLADWLNQRYGKAACVVIDGRNGVDVLADKIAETWKAKGSVIKPSVKNVLAAVSMLTDALAERNVTWYEKHEMLSDSALSSIRRPIGGGWGFGGEDSAPIEAAALALWGAKTSRRDPNRKMRVG